MQSSKFQGVEIQTQLEHSMDAPHGIQEVDTSTNSQPHVTRQEAQMMSTSTLFGSLQLSRANAGLVDQHEGEVTAAGSSLHRIDTTL